MTRILVFGNSGSGKSMLAKALSARHHAPHLDLDSIAWEPDDPDVRAPFETSRDALLRFIQGSERWVIEGCYSGLLTEAAAYCTEMIFLNPGVKACVANCRARPWEPHKYATQEAQDANLAMLVEWVRHYETREDEFSLREHRRLFDAHEGPKVEYRSNDESARRMLARIDDRLQEAGEQS